MAASQSVVPHEQLAPLTNMPFLAVQVGKELHELNKDVQNSSVADVQAPEAPQTHGAGLTVVPSPWAQEGPVKEPTVKLLEVLLSGL